MAAEDVKDVLEVDAKLDALDDPSSSEVWRATKGHTNRAIAAAAARRALEGGGGPGGPVALDDLTDVETAGGSEGDVLTQQGDGSFALEPPVGGSQPFGVVFENPVQLEDVRCARVQVSAATAGQDYTYDNGPDDDGIGATVTCAENALLEIDGVNPEVGDRVLFADDWQESINSFGIYTVTDIGADDPGGSPWVLTRAEDCNTDATFRRFWRVNISEGDSYQGGSAGVASMDPGFNIGDPSVYWSIKVARSSVPGLGTVYGLPDSDGLALGKQAVAARDGTAIGADARAFGEKSTAIGRTAKAEAEESTAIGHGTQVTDEKIGITNIDGPNGVILAHTGGNIGFYGTIPVLKPSITVGDAADILAALVTLGLVSDDT